MIIIHSSNPRLAEQFPGCQFSQEAGVMVLMSHNEETRARILQFSKANPDERIPIDYMESGVTQSFTILNGEVKPGINAGTLSPAKQESTATAVVEEPTEPEAAATEESAPDLQEAIESPVTEEKPVETALVEQAGGPSSTPDPTETVAKKASAKKDTPLWEKPGEREENAPIAEVPSTDYTADDAVAKFDKELQAINALCPNAMQSDSLWVIEQLKEKCRNDNAFVQYVMQENKSFKNAYTYVLALAGKKVMGTIFNGQAADPDFKILVGMPGASYGVDISRENSLPYFIEYYLFDEEKARNEKKKKDEERKKKQEAAIAKQKAETKSAKKAKARTSASVQVKPPVVAATVTAEDKPAAENAVEAAVKQNVPDNSKPKHTKVIDGQMSMFELVG